jgi:antitoxin VapB
MLTMALSIKTEEADRLARELAAATGESLTEAVTTALRERLERVRMRRQQVDIDFRMERLAVEYAALPIQDRRSVEDILGYDDAGLPA